MDGDIPEIGRGLCLRKPVRGVSEKDALPVLKRQRRIFQYPGYLHPGAHER
jgi:hypothetical protein